MKPQKTNGSVVIDVHVKPSSKQFRITVETDEIIVFCREAPVKGKVNRELMKELSKVFHRKMRILSGFTSRQKKVLIEHIRVDEVNKILSVYRSRRVY